MRSTLSADQIDQSINTPTTPKKRGTKTATSINAGNLMNMDY